MALSDFASDSDDSPTMSEKESDSSSSSSSSSGQSKLASKYGNRRNCVEVDTDKFDIDDHKYYDAVCPEVVIKRTADGLKTVRYPHTKEIYVGRGSEGLPDERIPESWVRYWSYKRSWQHVERTVRQYFDTDINELVRSDPERAMEIISEAAKAKAQDREPRNVHQRTCKLCDKQLHAVDDHNSYSHVEGRTVCNTHTVGQLAEHDII